MNEIRYTSKEAMNLYPDKYILMVRMQEDSDGFSRGVFVGAYNSVKERFEMAQSIPESERGALGLVDGIDFVKNRIGGLL